MRTDELLSRLEGVKRTGRAGWLVAPRTRIGRQSLKVDESDDKILIHCHAGCTPIAITDALGIAMSDLFIEDGWVSTGHTRRRPRPSPSRRRPTSPRRSTNTRTASGRPIFEVVPHCPRRSSCSACPAPTSGAACRDRGEAALPSAPDPEDDPRAPQPPHLDRRGREGRARDRGCGRRRHLQRRGCGQVEPALRQLPARRRRGPHRRRQGRGRARARAHGVGVARRHPRTRSCRRATARTLHDHLAAGGTLDDFVVHAEV